jgi:hypothetical protein
VPGGCWRREFPGEPCQLRVLRQWLVSLLPPCPARDDVVVVANELGSNAIVHTRSGYGGRFIVEITWSGAMVRVAVADGGAPAGPAEIDDPGAEHGRGLAVVRELSARRGTCGGQSGRLVWADVAWDSMPSAAAASPAGQEAAILGWVIAGSLQTAPPAQSWPLAGILAAGLAAILAALLGLRSAFFATPRESDTGPGRT